MNANEDRFKLDPPPYVNQPGAPTQLENPRPLLVLGGAGFLGHALAATLADRDGVAHLRIPTRRLRRGRELMPLPGLELVLANVHEEGRLAHLLDGCRGVVNLVGTLHGSAAEFQRVHAELPRRLAAACRMAGVRRLVHVSALGADANAPSNYLRSKAAGEAALKDSGLEVTVLRPSVMFGAEDRFMNRLASLQAWLPVMALGGADAQMQPVWVDDMALAIVRCLEDRKTIGETIECTGPHRYTLADLVRMAGQWSGHPRPILRLPDALARLVALLMELLPGEPPMSRDNLDSLKVPSVATGTLPGLQRLGISPTALEAISPIALSRYRGRARLEAWRMTGHA